MFHLALLLVFLPSLVLLVSRGFWRSPTPSPGPGEQPQVAKRQPELFLPGPMGPVWVGKGIGVSQDGEKQGIQAPPGRTFPLPDLLTDPFDPQINWMDQDHDEKHPHSHPEGIFSIKRLYVTRKL